MNPIAGRYPGGPRREPDPSAPRERPPEVREIEERGARRLMTGLRVRRRRRLATGISLILLAAVVAGGWLGVRSHATPEEVAREQGAASAAPEGLVREETDRVLRELWRMEALERRP